MRENIMWIARGKGRFLVAGSGYWGLVGGVIIFIIFAYRDQGLGAGEWIAVGVGSIIALLLGLLVSVMIWHLGVNRLPSSSVKSQVKSTGAAGGTAVFTRPQQASSVSALQFDINLDPLTAREAARVWFWRFVRRYRAWQLLSCVVFGLIIAIMAFWFQVRWVAVLFLVVTSLGLAYFPVFHFGFQVEASRVARRLRKLNLTLTDDELIVVGGNRRAKIDLLGIEYILERSNFFIVSYSRYAWIWLPHDDLPGSVLNRLRSHNCYIDMRRG